VPAWISFPPSFLLVCPLFRLPDDLQQVLSTLVGGWRLSELILPGFSFLTLYPSASWVLLAHLALHRFRITFNAPTNSQLGISNLRRPPVNHVKPPLSEPSGPFINSPYAPRQYKPHGLSALVLLCRHESWDFVWSTSTLLSSFQKLLHRVVPCSKEVGHCPPEGLFSRP
jgi:hypothetical protein